MIGGNKTVILQVHTTGKNRIGEPVEAWHDVMYLTGYLDLSGGDSKYTTYNAKMQESTHLFICDYVSIPKEINVDGKNIRVNAENCRMMADSQVYDVLIIDNPMELNQQLEIYMKYTGGQ